MQLQTATFTIHNGQVPCEFEFINKPDEETYCKQWLSAKPSRGFLLPGNPSLPRLCFLKALPVLFIFLHKLFASECFILCLRLLVFLRQGLSIM